MNQQVIGQQVIGDALSLSAVQVSRSLKRLREDGYICTEDGMVEIRDLQSLAKFSGFNPTYPAHNSNWARFA